MKVAGFTIIRNAIKFDYPVVEAITSVLPICDAFYVGVGKGEDETRELIKSIGSEKIIILDSVWDDSLREGGKVLAVETNKVFDAIPESFDWCFYIQSDECVHEEQLAGLREDMLKYWQDQNVEGLLFAYHHFYGQYKYVGAGRRWYRNEIRVIRNDKGIRSYKDAQGFRKKNGRKLKVKKTEAKIFHYGWVKPPKAQQAKQNSFHKMWHSDDWIKTNIKQGETFDYYNIDLLEEFKGNHPRVFEKRISQADWDFNYDSSKSKPNLRYLVLHWVEKLTGWNPGENKNYRELK
jgi:hypothetical protein